MFRYLLWVFLVSTACAQIVSSFSTTNSPVSSVPETTTQPAGSAPAIDKLPDLLPEPQGKPTLIGGTIAKTDRVRDEISVKIFGGGRMRVIFDSRTHIFRDGAPASASDLQNGERVYVDTMSAGKNVFAENIRIVTGEVAGRSLGQVVSYDPGSGQLVLSDVISPRQVRVQVVASTSVVRDGQAVSSGDIRPGTLVSVAFLPDGRRSLARQVSILAAPGNTFVFVGRVTHLDLHLGLLAVVDPRDQKSYEISFSPSAVDAVDNLQEGATVEATTTFNGVRYVANSIHVSPRSAQ